METAIEFEPEATRCRACIGTGMVQCDRCLLADSACDACGEQAKVLHGDERLPLCRKCATPVCWYCDAAATERRKELMDCRDSREVDMCQECADSARRGDELARRTDCGKDGE